MSNSSSEELPTLLIAAQEMLRMLRFLAHADEGTIGMEKEIERRIPGWEAAIVAAAARPGRRKKEKT